jgi:very-short-patch-repair endonuclease
MARIKGQKPLTADERREIARRYEAGEVLEALMAEYQRGKPTIKKVVQDAGIAIRRRGYATGGEWSPERRAAHKTATSTPEFAQKSREALLKRLPTMRGPATNTAIERRMHDALKKSGIGFTTQSLLLERYLVDIELHQAPIVIEADGSQHTLRDRKAKDAARDADLIAAGYRVFRFPGWEINADAAVCVQRVIDACGLVPDKEPVYEIRTRFAGASHPLWKGGKREYVCESCGETFLAQPKHRTGKHIYCSKKCYGKGKAGVKLGPMPAGQRAKIGAANRRNHQIKVESDLRGDAQRAAETTAPATLF